MASEPFETEGPGPLWLIQAEGRREGGLGRPLVCELLDRAAVTTLLVRERRPTDLAARFAASMRLAEEDAIAWVAFLVALHGLGKASPGFQGRDPSAALRLRAAGFRVDARARADHDAVTAREARRILRERFGVGPFLAARLGHAIAGGDAPPSGSAAGAGDAGDATPEWGLARDVLVAHLARFTGVGRLGPPSEELADDDGAFLELEALVAKATELTTDRALFPPMPPPRTVDEYAPVARARAPVAARARPRR
jgi:CRISPR-associated endonuclease/helicase Cas3